MDPAPGWPPPLGGGVSTGRNGPDCAGLLVPGAGAFSEGFVPPGSVSRGDEPDGAPGVVPAVTGNCLGGAIVHHCPGPDGRALGFSGALPESPLRGVSEDLPATG